MPPPCSILTCSLAKRYDLAATRLAAAGILARHTSTRRALCVTDLDFPGLRSAVHVVGTINNRRVVDKGWTVELVFPWAGMKWLAKDRSLPPKEVDDWNIFFGRFEKLEVANTRPEPQPAGCWTKHGTLDTHLPEKFTWVQFSNQSVDDL